MVKNLNQQIQELVAKSKRVLITTKRQFSGDGLAACLALFLILKKLNKNAEIIIDGFSCPDNLAFLPQVKEVKSEVVKLKKFILNLNIAQTGLDSLYYDIQGSFLRIHLTPHQGVFTPEDLKLEASSFAYDLIIVVDTPELENLGSLYDHHRDLFYQIPVINLDHSLTNEQYGHLNLINVTAAAVTEIIYNLISDWPNLTVDQPLASVLLAGLISKTQSFKTNQVTPQALKIAGELINLGANRKEIVTQLYQTKTVGTLKLWGKILSRLQAEEKIRLIWSKLDLHDFTEAGAAEKSLPAVIEELISFAPLVETVILFYQIALNKVKVICHSQGPVSALALVRIFSPQGDKNQATFTVLGDLNQAEKTVLAEITKQLKTSL